MENAKTKIGMFIIGFNKQNNRAKLKVSHVVWVIPVAIALVIFAILFSGANMSVCEMYIEPLYKTKITFNLYDKWLVYGLIFAFFLGISVLLTIQRYDKEPTALDKMNTASILGAIITLIIGGIIEFRDGFYAGGGYGFICFFLFMYLVIHLAILKAKKSGKIITGYNSTGPKIFAVKDLFALANEGANWLKPGIACANNDSKLADE